MKIRCKRCGEEADIKSRAAIEQYMKGEYAIGCRGCGMVMYNNSILIGKEEEKEWKD